MNVKSLAIVVLAFLPNALLLAQKDQGYRTLRMTSAFTSFPDSARANGFLDGDSVFRPAAGHYDDSSVLLVTPSHPKWGRKVDLLFWFHGWHNNIDTALQFYGLARQFADSKRTAVLVLPEAAKNAADSYGGKLRRDGDFRNLVGDVMKKLKDAGVVPRHAGPGEIILACHSGGYSAVADILAHGGQPVDAVWLFDALYGHLPVFTDWIRTDERHRFIHWFTNHGGGTDEMSDTLMRQLRSQHVDYLLTEETSLTPAMIRGNRILFVHSARVHNVIINNPDDFKLLLENSLLPAAKR